MKLTKHFDDSEMMCPCGCEEKKVDHDAVRLEAPDLLTPLVGLLGYHDVVFLKDAQPGQPRKGG